jgi:hypothetical protein
MKYGIVLLLFAITATASAQQISSTATETSIVVEEASTPASAPSLAIPRMELCGSVADRKPIDISSTFTVRQKKVYCYLEFNDVKKETTVTIVWLFGRNAKVKVPLTIKPAARFRTWSSKSIHGLKGDGRVDVLDEKGFVLGSATFTVH